MRNCFDLIDPRPVNPRIGVTDAHGKHAAEAIKILVALIVPDIFTLTFYKSDWLLVIGSNRRKKKLLVLADSFGNSGFSFLWIHNRYLTKVELRIGKTTGLLTSNSNRITRI